MTAVIHKQHWVALVLVSAGLFACSAARAGAEVSFYMTMPLGVNSPGHVLGLRLDRTAAIPSIRTYNPESPLNRRALLDLQVGADSAVRLELDRRLTWDISAQEWRPSSRPAFINLHIPTRKPQSDSASAAVEHAAQAAPSRNPLQDQSRKPMLKPFAVEP